MYASLASSATSEPLLELVVVVRVLVLNHYEHLPLDGSQALLLVDSESPGFTSIEHCCRDYRIE